MEGKTTRRNKHFGDKHIHEHQLETSKAEASCSRMQKDDFIKLTKVQPGAMGHIEGANRNVVRHMENLQ